MKNFIAFIACLALCAGSFAGTDPLPNWPGGILTTAGAPGNGTNAIQTLTFGATITSGTFRLAYKGFTTAAITWTATDATLVSRIDAALEALPTLAGGSSVTTAAGTISSGVNGTITVTFAGNYAKLLVPAITVADNSLVGAAHTLTAAITTAGVTADGRSAALGQLLIDSTNKTIYQNRGTSLNPTWTQIVGLAVTNSASLIGLLSDPDGTGLAVFGTGPTLAAAIVTPKVTTISGDGAITIASGVVVLTKGSAAAITLAAPSSQDGTRITVIANSDFAHVITAPSAIILDGTTGANTTATFAAFKGASITLVASGVTWLVESSNLVTCAP